MAKRVLQPNSSFAVPVLIFAYSEASVLKIMSRSPDLKSSSNDVNTVKLLACSLKPIRQMGFVGRFGAERHKMVRGRWPLR